MTDTELTNPRPGRAPSAKPEQALRTQAAGRHADPTGHTNPGPGARFREDTQSPQPKPGSKPAERTTPASALPEPTDRLLDRVVVNAEVKADRFHADARSTHLRRLSGDALVHGQRCDHNEAHVKRQTRNSANVFLPGPPLLRCLFSATYSCHITPLRHPSEVQCRGRTQPTTPDGPKVPEKAMTGEPRGATGKLLLAVAAPAVLTAAVACGGPPEDDSRGRSTTGGGPATNQLPDGTENAGPSGAVALERTNRGIRNLQWDRWNPIPYQYRGTRGVPRSAAEARAVWETIPPRLRMVGPELTDKVLANWDWSHIEPHSRGGSADAANGVFEPRSTNRARGARSMTPAAVDAARRALGSAATRATVQSALAGAGKAGGLTAAVGGMLAILKHGLDYADGRIDRAELLRRTAVDVGAAGLTGGGIAAALTGIATTAPVLAASAAVAAAALTVVGVIYIGTEAADLGGRWIELVSEHQSGARSRPTVARPPGGPEALEAAAPPDQATLELRAARERARDQRRLARRASNRRGTAPHTTTIPEP